MGQQCLVVQLEIGECSCHLHMSQTALKLKDYLSLCKCMPHSPLSTLWKVISIKIMLTSLETERAFALPTHLITVISHHSSCF